MSSATRLAYGQHGLLFDTDTIIVRKRNGGERAIRSDRWWIDRRTPCGEDAQLWERMSHNGNRAIQWRDVIGVEREDCSMLKTAEA